MINFDDFIYNKARVPADANEKTEFFKKVDQQFQDEIASTEAANEFFKQFNPVSVQSFIKSFASQKVSLAKAYDYYERIYNELETIELDFQNRAENMLKLILQKKLFNMQLLWRAGKLDIEGVDIIYDFQYWGSHITSCPFIAPIQEYEVEVLKEFLLRSEDEDAVDEYSYYSWQDYDSIMNKDENGLFDEMPAWYDFYDMRMGTSSLLILPDLKGVKEDRYLRLNQEEIKLNNPPKVPVTPMDPRPYLHGFGDDLTNFARLFEKDAYFSELFKYYEFANNKHNDINEDDITCAIDTLLNADRPIHLSNQLIWNEAIIAAANKYTATKIAEALDSVYENYRMMKDLGITENQTDDEINSSVLKDNICKIFRDGILNGRKFCGEPEDFNY